MESYLPLGSAGCSDGGGFNEDRTQKLFWDKAPDTAALVVSNQDDEYKYFTSNATPRNDLIQPAYCTANFSTALWNPAEPFGDYEAMVEDIQAPNISMNNQKQEQHQEQQIENSVDYSFILSQHLLDWDNQVINNAASCMTSSNNRNNCIFSASGADKNCDASPINYRLPLKTTSSNDTDQSKNSELSGRINIGNLSLDNQPAAIQSALNEMNMMSCANGNELNSFNLQQSNFVNNLYNGMSYDNITGQGLNSSSNLFFKLSIINKYSSISMTLH